MNKTHTPLSRSHDFPTPSGLSAPHLAINRFLILIIAFAVCLTGMSAELPSSGIATNLGIRLKEFSNDRTRSYQQLLRDSTHEVDHTTKNRSWNEVETMLRAQGFQQLKAYEGQWTIDYRYLVTTNGWSSSDGTHHSLYVEFMVDKRNTNEVAHAKPGFVLWAIAGLSVELERQYSDVLDTIRYPDNSVIFRGLRLPETLAATKNCPFITRMEINYRHLGGHRDEIIPQGFWLYISFRESAIDYKQGGSITILANSGLDPIEDRQGNSLQEHFTSQDTLDKSWVLSASSWKNTE